MLRSQHICKRCLGTSVQRVCWVDINDGDRVVEAFGDHDESDHGYTFCADCEREDWGDDQPSWPHPVIIDRLDSYSICEGCLGSRWPGIVLVPDNPHGDGSGVAVQKCGDCRGYAYRSDHEAAWALARFLSTETHPHRVETVERKVEESRDGKITVETYTDTYVTRLCDGQWSHLYPEALERQNDRITPDTD